MWTLVFEHHEDRTPTQGYEATREDRRGVEKKLRRRPKSFIEKSAIITGEYWLLRYRTTSNLVQ